MTESKSGDLHSNASTTKDSIKLSSELLKHHEGHDEEVLAIVAHELGHNKKQHLMQQLVINSFYMLIAGACLIPVTDHPPFLNAFNIHMKSYFLTISIFGVLFFRSVDIPLRLGILWK